MNYGRYEADLGSIDYPMRATPSVASGAKARPALWHFTQIPQLTSFAPYPTETKHPSSAQKWRSDCTHRRKENYMRITIVACLGLFASVAAFGQTPYTSSFSGADMYKSMCASCHGTGGKGDGPAASALKVSPPDLTQLSKKNRGKFPTQRVRAYIDGTGGSAAHGTREMPVWGQTLRGIEASEVAIRYRVTTLATYVESLQVK